MAGGDLDSWCELLWYEQHKLTGNEGLVHLFTILADWLGTPGGEKPFRLFVAAIEIVAAVLVLVPRTQALGALLALGTMSGAVRCWREWARSAAPGCRAPRARWSPSACGRGWWPTARCPARRPTPRPCSSARRCSGAPATLVAARVPREARWMHAAPALPLAKIGRRSLRVFCFGVPLAWAASSALAR